MKKKSNIYSKKWRISHLYKIVNKKGEVVTFVPNNVQEKIMEFESKHKRIIALKGRQFGYTTYKCIDKLDSALFYPNKKRIITAHKQEKLKEIFQIVKFAYEQLPEVIQDKENNITWVKPKAKYDNVNQLFFDDINSSISVTLDSRSTTVQDLHITELAFLQGAEDMMTGTLPAVPDDAPITIETTANGVS